MKCQFLSNFQKSFRYVFTEGLAVLDLMFWPEFLNTRVHKFYMATRRVTSIKAQFFGLNPLWTMAVWCHMDSAIFEITLTRSTSSS